MTYYAYRYQCYIDKVPTTHVILTCDSQLVEIIRLEGSCTAYAPKLKNNMTRVKPCNLLHIPPKYVPQRSLLSISRFWKSMDQLRASLKLIPWTVNFSTVNLDDYPEFFI